MAVNKRGEVYKRIRVMWDQERDARTGKFIKGSVKPLINPLSRAQALVMTITEDRETFDPKSFSGKELSKLRKPPLSAYPAYSTG
jgi:hypothetical protein